MELCKLIANARNNTKNISDMLKKKLYKAPASGMLEVYAEDPLLNVSGDANWSDEPGYPGGDDTIVDPPYQF